MSHNHEDYEDISVLVLIDEEDVEHEFELLAELEIADNAYRVLLPLMEDDETEAEEEEAEVIILKVLTDEDGNEFLADVEDDGEWEQVADAWQELVEQEEI